MKTETEIKYDILNFVARLSRKGITIKEYGERKLLDEILNYVDTLLDD